MEDEKLFPISTNSNLCVRCERCELRCPSKAIFFKNSLRYVDYNKCKGCLKCVDICEHGAIEVISIKQGHLFGFDINSDKCTLCKLCLETDFCFQNLFYLKKDDLTGEESIGFKKQSVSQCFNCLKCFKNCPNNAILPKIN